MDNLFWSNKRASDIDSKGVVAMNHILRQYKNFRILPMLLLYFFSFMIPILITLQVDAQQDEETVAIVITFEDGFATDSSKNKINGTIVGNPETVDGIVGKAMQFDGEGDGIKFPDNEHINTGGPYTDRTVATFFKCFDTSKTEKQLIFQEGGLNKGLTVYVQSGKVYVGGWNRTNYNWDGSWMSANIKSNRWHHVALVLRNTTNKVEDDKLELWLDGDLADTESGGQLYSHTNDTSIGYVLQKTIYHDGENEGTNVDWFEGIIDEVIVYNSAFEDADFAKITQPLSVEPNQKLTTTWGSLKNSQSVK